MFRINIFPKCGKRFRPLFSNTALLPRPLQASATASLRTLISQVRIVPDADTPGGHPLKIAEELSGIMALDQPESKKPPLVARAWSETVVAGAGFGHCFMQAP
ncbi:hypothetical protein [Leisingera sp. M658]|uniref:hypothetical protein n=1 Tax=Leisingera sp. M658 TaxID=2867015 RepID=UPI0021A799A7|nr:hypothetical protein [Leisingera sp. M658]UWQ75738.1 hypothetical protein K3724_04570 [Leisingera sp. M658]